MADREPNFSRMSRKKGKKDKLLNILIGIVVALILVVSATFLFGNNGEKAKDDVKDETASQETNENDTTQEEPVIEDDMEEEPAEPAAEKQTEPEQEGKIVNEAAKQDDGTVDNQSLTVMPSTDKNVKESVVNPDWKPIGTKQTGEHVSRYDGESDDWYEKKEAIAYATGITENDLIYWRIQNGGSPQKAEGIVSDKSKDKKFKVYLEWVDGEGWKPVKMDVLETLETK